MFSLITVDDDGGRGPDVELMAVVRILLMVGIMFRDDGGMIMVVPGDVTSDGAVG